MGSKTRIEWTDYTWNPVTGCTKVSQGCKHCYAERLAPKVFAGQRVKVLAESDYPTFGEKKGDMIGMRDRRFTDVRWHPERLDAPLHMRKPRRIFVNSMSDLFHEDVPDSFLPEVFAVMVAASQHTFQILTKRAARMRDVLTDDVFFDAVECIARQQYGVTISADEWPLRNVWLGVSVEDQATADERIPLLLQTPAAVRWISAEPLLGPVDVRTHLEIGNLDRGLGEPGLDWVVTGGESGPKARPSHPDWFRSLRDQCAAAGVPFLFKQWGEWAPHTASIEQLDGTIKTTPNGGVNWRAHTPGGIAGMFRVGKKAAGRTLDGRVHDEYPA